MGRPFTTSSHCAVAWILWIGLMGCHRYDRPPVHPRPDPAFTTAEVDAPGITDDPAEPMRILPGDVILLRAFSAENTEYGGLVVDEQGQPARSSGG